MFDWVLYYPLLIPVEILYGNQRTKVLINKWQYVILPFPNLLENDLLSRSLANALGGRLKYAIFLRLVENFGDIIFQNYHVVSTVWLILLFQNLIWSGYTSADYVKKTSFALSTLLKNCHMPLMYLSFKAN